MIIIFLLTGGVLFFGAPIKIPWKENPHYHNIQGWHKVFPLAEAFPVRMETAHQEEMAIYQNTAGFELHFYTGYFECQSSGKELIDITTARLHEGAEEIMIPIQGSQSMRVNKGIYKRNEQMHLIVFWYEMDGQVISRWTDIKRLTLWNALKKRQTNGSIVVISAPFGPQDHPTQLLEKQVEFVRHLIAA